jgi:hypothetical protein
MARKALLSTNKNKGVRVMFLQLQAVRKLIHRYLRRFVRLMTAVDAARLARRLERRVPLDLKGPATRAIVHQDIVDLARRHGIPVTG